LFAIARTAGRALSHHTSRVRRDMTMDVTDAPQAPALRE